MKNMEELGNKCPTTIEKGVSHLVEYHQAMGNGAGLNKRSRYSLICMVTCSSRNRRVVSSEHG